MLLNASPVTGDMCAWVAGQLTKESICTTKPDKGTAACTNLCCLHTKSKKWLWVRELMEDGLRRELLWWPGGQARYWFLISNKISRWTWFTHFTLFQGVLIQWCASSWASSTSSAAAGVDKSKRLLFKKDRFGRIHAAYFSLCSFFIGPRSDHSLLLSVTHWLTHWQTCWRLNKLT